MRFTYSGTSSSCSPNCSVKQSCEDIHARKLPAFHSKLTKKVVTYAYFYHRVVVVNEMVLRFKDFKVSCESSSLHFDKGVSLCYEDGLTE